MIKPSMLPTDYEMITSKNRTVKKIVIVCGILLLSMLSAFWMLSKDTLNNHECFVSITAREMLESGNWIMPTCNDESRLQKTPLSYWLVAGFANLTGKVDEFTTRLPSAIFAVLSAAAILYFVSQWLSFRIAVLSTAVWVTSLSYIRYSHNARPEMSLTFFTTLCFLSFYSAITAMTRKRQVIYMLVFWVSFGLANLAKGPAPLPLVLVPLFFYIAVSRQWKKVPKLIPIIGTIIFLAIVLPWPLAVGYKVGWNLAIWKTQFFDRLTGKYASGHKAFYFYLYIMFQFILPWAAFLPIALAAPFYRVWRKKRTLMWFCWIWFVADLFFLTINGGKRQHYIIPLLPAMAIIISIILNDMIFAREAYTHNFARNILQCHIAVIIIAAITIPFFAAKFEPELLANTIIFSIITIAIISAIALLFAFRHPASACTAMFLGIVVLFMVSYRSFTNLWDINRYSRIFATNSAKIVPPESSLIAYKNVSKRFVHYFGRVVPEVEDESLLYRHYEKGDWVVATSDYLNELLQDGGFRMVYYKEKAERQGNADTAGALFNKTAPVIKDCNNCNLKMASILPRL